MAIWRNLSAMALIYSEISTKGLPQAKRLRPLVVTTLKVAAGAMIYVISDEIIPETHTKGHERIATLGTILGVIVMLYLDVSLA